jgi:hypothetical protein
MVGFAIAVGARMGKKQKVKPLITKPITRIFYPYFAFNEPFKLAIGAACAEVAFVTCIFEG